MIKIKLPEEERSAEDLTPEEIRSRMKERGLIKPRPWTERPIFISCTGGIFEPYVPPEGDGKFSAISKIVRTLWFSFSFSIFIFCVIKFGFY